MNEIKGPRLANDFQMLTSDWLTSLKGMLETLKGPRARRGGGGPADHAGRLDAAHFLHRITFFAADQTDACVDIKRAEGIKKDLFALLTYTSLCLKTQAYH